VQPNLFFLVRHIFSIINCLPWKSCKWYFFISFISLFFFSKYSSILGKSCIEEYASLFHTVCYDAILLRHWSITVWRKNDNWIFAGCSSCQRWPTDLKHGKVTVIDFPELVLIFGAESWTSQPSLQTIENSFELIKIMWWFTWYVSLLIHSWPYRGWSLLFWCFVERYMDDKIDSHSIILRHDCVPWAGAENPWWLLISLKFYPSPADRAVWSLALLASQYSISLPGFYHQWSLVEFMSLRRNAGNDLLRCIALRGVPSSFHGWQLVSLCKR